MDTRDSPNWCTFIHWLEYIIRIFIQLYQIRIRDLIGVQLYTNQGWLLYTKYVMSHILGHTACKTFVPPILCICASHVTQSTVSYRDADAGGWRIRLHAPLSNWKYCMWMYTETWCITFAFKKLEEHLRNILENKSDWLNSDFWLRK